MGGANGKVAYIGILFGNASGCTVPTDSMQTPKAPSDPKGILSQQPKNPR